MTDSLKTITVTHLKPNLYSVLTMLPFCVLLFAFASVCSTALINQIPVATNALSADHVHKASLAITTSYPPTSTPSCLIPQALPHNHIHRRDGPRSSFTDMPAYTSLSNCARPCLEGYYNIGAGIWGYSNCDADTCACREDKQPGIVGGISSCVRKECGESSSTDYSIATDIYSSFCNFTGAVAQPTIPTGTPASGSALRSFPSEWNFLLGVRHFDKVLVRQLIFNADDPTGGIPVPPVVSGNTSRTFK